MVVYEFFKIEYDHYIREQSWQLNVPRLDNQSRNVEISFVHQLLV
jgi:hypothetical protein